VIADFRLNLQSPILNLQSQIRLNPQSQILLGLGPSAGFSIELPITNPQSSITNPFGGGGSCRIKKARPGTPLPGRLGANHTLLRREA
jgi:hypothetical protein